MRIALYWTPKPSSLLENVATAWLRGGSNVLPALSKKERQQILAAPNHYGLHATIIPPFRLQPEYYLADVENEVTTFVQEERNRPFTLGKLVVAEIGSFFCLKPEEDSIELQRFAARTVRHFDHFRKPADEIELQRRRAAGLTPRQDQLLLDWGYPYVLEEYRFHLTLTGKINSNAHREVIKEELMKRFEAATREPLEFASLSLFLQHGSHPFLEYKRWELGEQLLNIQPAGPEPVPSLK